MKTNKEFSFEELPTADLHVDALYRGRRSANAGDDPLNKLLGVSLMGGFRYLGNLDALKLVVLTTSLNNPDWPDVVDRETGTSRISATTRSGYGPLATTARKQLQADRAVLAGGTRRSERLLFGRDQIEHFVVLR